MVCLLLAGCQGMEMPGFLAKKPEVSEEGAAGTSNASAGEERDVEAPEIFEAKEKGLWDGRPSLGGVWVAHPDVKEPERVIVRNEGNGKYVIGALFRRERETPGPRIQVSSDAAAALDMLAGAPASLSVVALRREVVQETPPPAAPEPQLTGALDAPSDIETVTIDDLAATATAALDAPAPAAPKPAAPAPAASGNVAKPFIQIGIFSVEQNANNTATAMRQAGMVPTVKKQTSKGKTFWRVLVGPAQSKSEVNTLMKQVKAQGFADAYTVSN
ncbi:hypothetical protein PRI8871_01107 [Pseudoprimorskyibacter insulae]|uniref:SPOR domain-containing protein n=2 Tax=Pseudoprimorskyibacter insulae TaxID=1695997 RepID=A0A2R8AR12_9RHOB|nr:hypothetical protein PRI8871_01107 [Pseudoprimorskyibacter insulae]